MKKIGGLIFCFLLFYSIKVNASVFSGLVFPDSEKHNSILPISLKLGESWENKSGKKYTGHLGEDFVGKEGENIYSIGDGIVEIVTDWPACPLSKNHGWGPVIIVRQYMDAPQKYNSEGTIISKGTLENPNEILVQYAHLSEITVSPGDTVQKGQLLGKIGKICPYIPHLHFEIKDEIALRDDGGNGGVGRGYSGTDGYAPHRYSPSEFIELNKHLVIGDGHDESHDQHDSNSTPSPSFLEAFGKTLDPLNFWNRWFHDDVEAEEIIPIIIPNKKDAEVEEIVSKEVVWNGLFVDPSLRIEGIAGTTSTIRLRVKNTGTDAWPSSAVSLNVVGGKEKNAVWYDPSWVTALRPQNIRKAVSKNESVDVSFVIHIPEKLGTHRLSLQLVRSSSNSFLQVGTSVVEITVVATEYTKPKEQLKNSTKEMVLSPVKKKEETQLSPKLIDPVTEKEKDTPIRLHGGGTTDSDNEEEQSEQIQDNQTTIIEHNDEEEHLQDETIIIAEPVVIFSSPLIDPYHDITSSSLYVFSGIASDTISYVLMSDQFNHVVTTTVTNGQWHLAQQLREGEQTLTYVGVTDDGRFSSSTPLVITLDTVAPSITLEDIVYDTSLSISAISSDAIFFDMQFLFPPEPGNILDVCPEENAVFDSFSSPLLQSQDAFFLGTTDTPCVWFSSSTIASQLLVSFPPDIASLPIVARFRAYDAIGNVSDWIYTDMLFPPNFMNHHELVVITEIGWMGTQASPTHEWIELYNPSFDPVTLSLWQLVWEGGEIIFDSVVIEPDGYVVVEHNTQDTIRDFDGVVYTGELDDTGEHIRLINASGEQIDEVDASLGWFAGNDETKESMARISWIAHANNPTSWCTYTDCREYVFRREEDFRHDALGTPILGSPGVRVVVEVEPAF